MLALSVANPYDYALDFARLKEVAKAVLEGEGIASAKVTFAFVSNAHIHRLNKQYLDHDEPTDVLTFPYSVKGAKKLEGEVVIGDEVAAEYAADRGHGVELERQLYVIHGCLHLCGYNDIDAKTEARMRERERHYLKLLGLPDIAGE
jgi:probable rRNA maturation factor